MQLFRAIVVLAAVAAAVGQYLQEHYRLLAIDKLPVGQALDRYEKRRVRSERMLLVLTLLSAVAGLAALGDMFIGFGR